MIPHFISDDIHIKKPRININYKKIISKRFDTINLVYPTVFSFLLLSTLIWIFSADLGVNLFSEAVGTVFTVVLIDKLINHSNRTKWKIVKDDIDYLISRNVFRLRENVLSRLFDFNPNVIDNDLDSDTLEKDLRYQRAEKLEELYRLTPQLMRQALDKKFNDNENVVYFEERAAEMWQYLDMMHSEYLSPAVVHCLIDLYVNMKDLCSHMRIYTKGHQFLKKNKYYIEIATEGVLFNLKNVIGILIKLKKHGYSEPAKRE